MKNNVFILVFFLFTLSVEAQDGTRASGKKNEREVASTHKVLLVPFEPKLYLGEIDRYIHMETNLSAREIKNKFRDGLNEQLFKAFKSSKYGVIDLMDDTVKYKKDLEGLYQYLSYDYLPVPDQKNYVAPKKEKTEKKIDKGQLIVETNSEKRFMEAHLTSQKVIPVMYAKYKTDVFVFVNQLDIFAGGSKDPLDLGVASTNRRIVVHYTIFNKDGIRINSGTVEEEFDPQLNIPKKIIEKYFSMIANTMVQRVNNSLLQSK